MLLADQPVLHLIGRVIRLDPDGFKELEALKCELYLLAVAGPVRSGRGVNALRRCVPLASLLWPFALGRSGLDGRRSLVSGAGLMALANVLPGRPAVPAPGVPAPGVPAPGVPVLCGGLSGERLE